MSNRKKLKRSTIISLRVENDMLDKVETILPEKDVSSKLRYFIELGMIAEQHKFDIKDPNFVRKIEELKEENNLFSWVKNLKDNELEAILAATKMEKEERYVQTRFT